MSKPTLPLQGGCRCGAVRLEVTAPPIITMACHCTGCQRMTSAPYSLSAAFPSEHFRVTKGEPVIGGMKASPKHYFCPSCMSWVFTMMDGMEWFVNVRATMLDNTEWATPFVEIWTSERLPWATTPAKHSFEGIPSFDDFGKLTAAYGETLA